MPSKPLLFHAVIWLPMAVAASLIIYVFLGVEDRTWAAQAASTARNAGFMINLLAFVLILNAKQYWIIGVNLFFFFLMLTCAVLGVADSFPGTGGRYGNQWADISAGIGLFNYLVVSATLPTQWMIAFAVLGGAFPVVTLATYVALTTPLRQEFSDNDRNTTCMYRITQPNWGIAKFDRIYSLSELNLGFFVGEHSPRVAKVQGDDAFLWEFGTREFSDSFREAGLSSKLRTELVQHCAIGREKVTSIY